MLKRFFGIVMICLLVSSCYSSGGQIRLFNKYAFFGEEASTVKVAKGDTLYSISKRYDVSLNDLIKANNLEPPYSLNVGQSLKLPVSKYHVVQKGDTLYAIARKYNTDVSNLAKINGLESPYSLNVGQKIALSGNAVSKNVTQSKKTVVKSKTSTKTAYVPPKNRTSKFAWPVKGKIISGFGTIGKGRKNDGINIKASLGTDVNAADSGTVAYAGSELKGFGNLILIKHSDGWITAYAHNQKLFVRKGQKVTRGEKIATVGQTGGVNTPQLHFEVRAGKKAVDPRKYLP